MLTTANRSPTISPTYQFAMQDLSGSEFAVVCAIAPTTITEADLLFNGFLAPQCGRGARTGHDHLLSQPVYHFTQYTTFCTSSNLSSHSLGASQSPAVYRSARCPVLIASPFSP
jgi:hypothetical protein